MNQDTLKDLTDVEIQDKLESERAALQKLRFNHAVSPVESTAKMRGMRRNVARILTEVRRREIENEAQG